MVSKESNAAWFGRAVVLAGIVGLALAMRLHGIDRNALWIDEAMTITTSNWSFANLLLYPVDPTPGLYYYLHKVLVAPGASLLQIRSISLVAGVAAVPLIFLLGKVLYGDRVGLIAAALLAVWPLHVAHSQDARAYALLFALTLCCSLGVAAYAKAWLGGTPRSRGYRLGALALFSAGAVLAFNTHLTSIFWIAGTALLLVMTALLSRRREAWAEVVACGALTALLAGPGLYRLALEATSPDAFNWLVQADASGLARTLAAVLLPPVPALADQTAARAVWILMLLVLAVLAVVALRRSPLRLEVATVVPGLLLLGYLLTPLAIWATGFVATPIFMERTILYAAPGAILLIALVCDRAGDRIGTVAATGVVLLCLAGAVLAPPSTRQDWRGATRELAVRARPGDVVVMCPFWQYPAMRHALRRPLGVRSAFVHYSGELMELEPSLGSDPRWDLAYHQRVEAPDAEKALGRDLEPAPAHAPSRPIVLIPGTSVWEISGLCVGPDRALTEAVLPSALGPPESVWVQAGTSEDRVRLSRRAVVAPGAVAAHAPGAAPKG